MIKNGTDFTFSNGKMTKDVLRNYLSRAVSHMGLCVENNMRDAFFEEDLRMLKRVGAKFIGRAAFYSWGGNMSYEQIEEHYKVARETAARAHEVDPEFILQAGVFEIMFKGTVNSTPIPSWIFEEFGLKPENRNFDFNKMLPPEESRFGMGYWGGNPDAAVPFIGTVEAQMYFYYSICRYIDAGFEAIHLGQVEFIMSLDDKYLPDWDRVLTKAREYAKKHARRGVVLFDGHREPDSSGFKVGNRLLFDYYACGAVPHETEVKDGAEQARIAHCDDKPFSWFGKSVGGIHPQGYETELAFTIGEFDNFNGTCGGIGIPHKKQLHPPFCWGYDIITWFALQPQWYQRQYLIESDEYLKTIELDENGVQTCFMQMPCRRVICPEKDDRPVFKVRLNDNTDIKDLEYFFRTERIEYEFNEKTRELTLTQCMDSIYRCNTQSDNCLTGSNLEDTIREIFLGNDA